MIPCPEFIKSMIHMGIVENEKEMKEKTDSHKKDGKLVKIHEKAKEMEFARKISLEYSRNFTDNDMENALRMLTDAARKYVWKNSFICDLSPTSMLFLIYHTEQIYFQLVLTIFVSPVLSYFFLLSLSLYNLFSCPFERRL